MSEKLWQPTLVSPKLNDHSAILPIILNMQVYLNVVSCIYAGVQVLPECDDYIAVKELIPTEHSLLLNIVHAWENEHCFQLVHDNIM